MEAPSLKHQVFNHLLATRGPKYKWFLRALRSFRYVSMSPGKAEFLESYYALMRYVDDIVDGDAPIPNGYHSSEDFVLEKIAFAQKPAYPKDSVDYLMLDCFELGNGFGGDFSAETQDILQSMLFDAKRYGTGRVFPQRELQYHFHLLDVRGTIRAALKVFEEDSQKYHFLEPLGLATRIYYNLRDYDEDILAGLVNISAEDCETYHIGNKDLENRMSEPVQKWIRAQAEHGCTLLQDHKKQIDTAEFRWLVRVTLPLVYVRPAQKYFNKTLA